jgi:hypothetical protein
MPRALRSSAFAFAAGTVTFAFFHNGTGTPPAFLTDAPAGERLALPVNHIRHR